MSRQVNRTHEQAFSLIASAAWALDRVSLSEQFEAGMLHHVRRVVCGQYRQIGACEISSPSAILPYIAAVEKRQLRKRAGRIQLSADPKGCTLVPRNCRHG